MTITKEQALEAVYQLEGVRTTVAAEGYMVATMCATLRQFIEQASAAPAPALTDEQVKQRAAEAGLRWIDPIPDDDGEIGYPGGFDMSSLAEVRALLQAAPQPAVQPTDDAEAFVRMLLWDDFAQCCGQPVVGAEYMCQQEMICCGNPEPGLLSDAEIVLKLRERFTFCAYCGGNDETPPDHCQDCTRLVAATQAEPPAQAAGVPGAAKPVTGESAC